MLLGRYKVSKVSFPYDAVAVRFFMFVVHVQIFYLVIVSLTRIQS